MSKILVCKKVRLGQDGGKFKKNLEAKVERTNLKIEEHLMDEFNANWKVSGRLYVVDDKATKERNAKLESKLEDTPDIDKMTVEKLQAYILENDLEVDVDQKKADLVSAIKAAELIK